MAELQRLVALWEAMLEMTSFDSIQGRRARGRRLFRLETPGILGASAYDTSVGCLWSSEDELTGDFAASSKDSRGTCIIESYVTEIAAVCIGCKLNGSTGDIVVVIAVEPGAGRTVWCSVLQGTCNFLALEPSLAASRREWSVWIE